MHEPIKAILHDKQLDAPSSQVVPKPAGGNEGADCAGRHMQPLSCSLQFLNKTFGIKYGVWMVENGYVELC